MGHLLDEYLRRCGIALVYRRAADGNRCRVTTCAARVCHVVQQHEACGSAIFENRVGRSKFAAVVGLQVNNLSIARGSECFGHDNSAVECRANSPLVECRLVCRRRYRDINMTCSQLALHGELTSERLYKALIHVICSKSPEHVNSRCNTHSGHQRAALRPKSCYKPSGDHNRAPRGPRRSCH